MKNDTLTNALAKIGVNSIKKTPHNPNPKIKAFVVNGVSYIRTRSGGVIHVSNDGKKVTICSSFRLVAHVTNDRTNGVMVQVQFISLNGELKTVLIAPSEFGKPGPLSDKLMNLGLRIDELDLTKLFLSSLYKHKPPIAEIHRVSKPGWYSSEGSSESKVYVNNGKVFKPADMACNLELDDGVGAVFSSKGTHESWLENVAAPCQGNPRLMLMMCASLLGPMLELIGYHNVGIHIYGSTKEGKTTGFIVVCSIYGYETLINSWNSTANALQETASSHNDFVIFLDEIKQCKPEYVSTAAYDLLNGVTKSRMGSDIKLNRVSRFQTVVISNGETSIETHLEERGLEVSPGQLNRLVSIPLHPKNGMFSDLHGEANKSEFASMLRRNAKANFGTAGPLWIQCLVDNQLELRRDLPSQLQKIEFQLLKSAGFDTPTASQHDIAKSLAAIACAGELAITHGILPWSKGDAIAAVKTCFKAWHRKEDAVAVASASDYKSLKKFFTANVSNFLPLNQYDKTKHDVVYTHEVNGSAVFLVTPAHFEKTLCGKTGKRNGIDALKKRGLLVESTRNGPTRQVQIPKKSKQQTEIVKPGFYVIRSKILSVA